MGKKIFRTAFLGGFRKKDVVNYLSEEKQRQQEETDTLQGQVEALQQQADQTQQLEETLTALQKENDELKQQLEALREAYDRSIHSPEVDILRARVKTLEAQVIPPEERKKMEDALRESRENTAHLEHQLLLLQTAKGLADPEQLGALCERMERTLTQMDRVLDGPYHITCYPEQGNCIKTPEKQQPSADPCADKPQPENDASQLSRLLAHVRSNQKEQ